MRTPLTLIVAFLAVFAVNEIAAAQPCFIFMHGKRTNDATYNDWSEARDYWIDYDWWNGDEKFVDAATADGAKHYIIGYDGSSAYWSSRAAGKVASEIMNAVNGGADGGGNRCTGATSYWVVAHSMGNTVMDWILGNNDSSDPYYNYNGDYAGVASNVSRVISVAGAHRGSQLADAACNELNVICDAIGDVAGFFTDNDCDSATSWLRSADSAQVKTYANSPARPVYLTGGWEAIAGTSMCLSGEDDGVLQYPSMFACSGDPGRSQSRSQTCSDGSGDKQESYRFYNLDTSHEDHDEIRNDNDRDTRRAVPGGYWWCSDTNSLCATDRKLWSSKSTAQVINYMY